MKRVFKNHTFNVIKSGSDGNCTVIDEEIMIDCGITLKEIEHRELLKIKTLLITHKHSDHLNIPLIKKMLKLNPTLLIITNQNTLDHLNPKLKTSFLKIILEHGVSANLQNGIAVSVYEMEHDVPCIGFHISLENAEVMYFTDTNTTKHIPSHLKFDVILGEANYDYDTAVAIAKMGTNRDVMRVNSNLDRHLSKQDLNKFAVAQLREHGTSLLIKLHKSKQFYR